MNQPTAANAPARRLIAAGLIRRLDGRTLTVSATEAGVTGRITPAPAQDQDDVFLVAEAVGVVTGR